MNNSVVTSSSRQVSLHSCFQRYNKYKKSTKKFESFHQKIKLHVFMGHGVELTELLVDCSQVRCTQKRRCCRFCTCTFSSLARWYHVCVVSSYCPMIFWNIVILFLTVCLYMNHCYHLNMTTLRSGICCRKSVCPLSVTFVHLTQPVEIFPFCTQANCWHPCKILQRSSQGNPLRQGWPNIAKLDLSKAISEKVQDTASDTIND